MYTNAQSLISKIDELETIVSMKNPDIVAITESWCHSNILNSEIHLSGYHMYRQDRKDTKDGRGGGILIYVRSTLGSVAWDQANVDCNFSSHLWCKIGNLHFGVVYRSPNSTSENNDLLSGLVSLIKDKHVVMVGDFNYPNIDWKARTSSASASSFLDCVNDSSLYQHVDFPTRGRNTLDLVLSSEEAMVTDLKSSGILGGSDHYLLEFDLALTTNKKESEEIVPDFSKANIPELKKALKDINWHNRFASKSVQEQWACLDEVLSEKCAKFIPSKRRRVNNKPLWLTRDIKTTINRKKKLWKVYKLTHADKDLNAYKQHAKKCKAEIRKGKLLFEQKVANQAKQNPKVFFRYTRSKMRTRDTVGVLMDDNGALVNSDKGVADTLNKYFSSVFTHEGINMPTPQMLFHGRDEDKLALIKVTQDEVEKMLANINENKSPGPDKIYPYILKTLAHELSEPICMIFNKSVTEGQVPCEWKDANVTPIFKKGNRQEPCNYRPISLTSVICKCLETIIKRRIIDHVNKNKLLNKSQHGFLESRSCLTNLLEFLEDVTSMIDDGDPVDVVYLDFQKAFDKVSHRRLLAKLTAHGIDGNVLSWIRCWLADRRQRVVLNGVHSEWIKVASGVPQGSVLGPLLFLLYINDIDNAVSVKIKKFADDTKLYARVGSQEQIALMQQSLNNCLEWGEDWQMRFNHDKCKVLHLGHGNGKFDYTLNGTPLAEVQCEKDLGVIIDQTLKPSKQCSAAAAKANRVLGVIRRSFHSRSKDIIVKLYKSLVRPHLEYAIQAWSPFLQKDIDVLEKVQRRATKMVDGLKDLPYNERLKVLGLTTLKTRRVRGDLIEVFKIMHGYDDISKDRFFKLRNSERLRGNSLSLEVPISRLDVRKYCFSQRIVSVWNRLPESVVLSASVNTFKNRVDTLITNGFIVDNPFRQ